MTITAGIVSLSPEKVCRIRNQPDFSNIGRLSLSAWRR